VRAYSVAKAAVCGQCHEDAFKQHEGSVQPNGCARAAPGAHVRVVMACVVTPNGLPDLRRLPFRSAGAHRQWLPNAALHHEVCPCRMPRRPHCAWCGGPYPQAGGVSGEPGSRNHNRWTRQQRARARSCSSW
jgi:hypothetical protein